MFVGLVAAYSPAFVFNCLPNFLMTDDIDRKVLEQPSATIHAKVAIAGTIVNQYLVAY